MNVPRNLRLHLEQWLPKAKHRMLTARDDSFKQLGLHNVSTRVEHAEIRLGSDCSGLDAPAWALRQMGMNWTHIFACDIDSASKEFVLANFKPRVWFDNCCTRKPEALLQTEFNAYVSGFPCQPFSKMGVRRGFRDPRSAVLHAVLRSIKLGGPAWAVLENVLGIKKHLVAVKAKIQQYLGGDYIVFVLPLCPSDLGEPVRRPRIWFILVRRSCAISEDTAALISIMQAMLTSLVPLRSQDTLADRMMPDSHPSVQGTSSTAAALTDRAASVWKEAKTANAGLWRSSFAADVSQSSGRVNVGRDICPCLTRSSTILVNRGQSTRFLTNEEKLSLHHFPVHCVNQPESVSATNWKSLIGNTQHVQVVGIIMLLAAALVRWRGAAPASYGSVPGASQLSMTALKAKWENTDVTLTTTLIKRSRKQTAMKTMTMKKHDGKNQRQKQNQNHNNKLEAAGSCQKTCQGPRSLVLNKKTVHKPRSSK
jgi:site-specific DNA-cytosine methylase